MATDYIACSNCGKDNHLQRECKDPLTSYGIICFHNFPLENENVIINDISTTQNINKIIMIRRKDTIGYMELMRGKYNINNDEYIIKLIDLMTSQEKERILQVGDFDKLRTLLGMTKKNNIYKNEYDNAKKKFNYLINTKINTLSKLEYLISKSTITWNETEWGLPKGRKHQKESNINCAVREFLEETGLLINDISLLLNIKPIEEIYTSINNIKYKHVYYFAKFINNNTTLKYNPKNKNQNKEISDINWFGLDECITKLRPYYNEKKKIILDSYKLFDMINIFCYEN
jgi:8-oxo-dGTP pyrophosphatase MutT (NUDIX family)